MKKISRRNFLKAAALSAGALGLAACGGSSSSTATSSAASTAAGSTSSAASVAPVAGDGVLKIGYSIVPDTLTVFRANTNRDAPYFPLLCEQLAIFDSSANLQPWCAKSWNTEDNGFNYDIEICEGIKDSAGNAIDASDIVWFMQKSMEAALKPVWGKVVSVEQTGDYTLHVELASNMVGTFETVLTDTYVISKAAFEASKDEFGTELVSSSPYKVTEYTASSTMTIEKRDDYWQDESNMPANVQPKVQKMKWTQIQEASQQGIALETGDVDMVIRIDTTTGAQFAGNDSFVMDLSDGVQGWTMFFSGADTSPCANDQNLRQAIAYAIDNEGLITGLCAGYGTPMYDAHSPCHVGALEKWKDEEYYPYDEAKAKELLAASDYSGQTLKILCGSSTFTSRMSQMIQSYLLNIGINVEIDAADMARLTAIRLDGTQYDMFTNTIGGTYLADAWSIRYDPAAYATGDGTSRHDYDLAELLYKTWTPDGYTEENIDEVHNYIKESCIAYGLVDPQNMCIYRATLGLQGEAVYGSTRELAPASCEWAGI